MSKQGAISGDEFRRLSPFDLPAKSDDDGAKHKLLTTVGGMTGAVNIFNAMGQGSMSPDSAALLLSLFFELPETSARNIVGQGAVSVDKRLASLQEAVEELKKPVKVQLPNLETRLAFTNRTNDNGQLVATT